MEAPIAKKKPKTLVTHNDARSDPYYWLSERDNPEVIEYLKQENEYTKQQMATTESLQDTLFDEITARIVATDMSVPYRLRGFWYHRRYEEGKEYPIYGRNLHDEDLEQILLDVNDLAQPYEYYATGALTISPNNQLLAFGEDTLSRRIFTLRFKDLNTGEFLPDRIENTTGHAVWANDNKTIFYTRKDQSLRPFKIFRHILGSDPKEDIEVYHEADDTFYTTAYRSKTGDYIIIASRATQSSEYRILSADQPLGEFRVFQSRESKHEYSISHDQEGFLIVTNWNAINFRLMRCAEQQTEKSHWQEVLPHDEKTLLEDVEPFRDFIVLEERHEGLSRLRILDRTGQLHQIAFDQKAITVSTGINPEYDASTVRIDYTSMTTPPTVLEYNPKTRDRKTLKKQEVPGNFDEDNYRSERLMVPSHDNTPVPVSLVWHKSYQADGTRPLLLYGYGSYGYSMDPYFSLARISLLDRGFAFAIAHIRGGEEMGRKWYEDGKFLKKKNTFLDFIACGRFLIEKKFAAPNLLFGMGGSAGGLLIGASINMAPTLFRAVIAAVPFVDVLTTMLDESIPLTTGEYAEWGNPNDPIYYDYIKSYSPYDNVEGKDYPSMLVTTGLHDSQVQYWEPAKWVARLRATKTDQNLLLLKTDLDTGHGGASGRYKRYRETALEYAFLLKMADQLV